MVITFIFNEVAFMVFAFRVISGGNHVFIAV